MGIKSFFKRFAKGFRILFDRIMGKGALKAIGIAAKELAKSELGKIAASVVEELQYENLTGSEKRRKAIKLIKDQAKEKGLEYNEGLIRTLIQIFVTRLQGSVDD